MLWSVFIGKVFEVYFVYGIVESLDYKYVKLVILMVYELVLEVDR